ncbi:hypothetical protein AOLI_G00164520 [Acnodon oligacanthus]
MSGRVRSASRRDWLICKRNANGADIQTRWPSTRVVSLGRAGRTSLAVFSCFYRLYRRSAREGVPGS